MGIFVDFLAGNGQEIIKAIEKNNFSALDSRAVCVGRAEFKFFLLPEEAMDPLVTLAAELRNKQALPFDSYVCGYKECSGESFCCVVNPKLVDLFADITASEIPMLAKIWVEKLEAFDSRPEEPRPQRELPRWIGRFRRAFTTAIIAIIVVPILGICMLNPSFRKERAMNKTKMENKKPPQCPTTEMQLTDLVDLCKKARDGSMDVVFSCSL